MAQNITLLGASYAAVPAVELPKTGGGTATFTDVTDTTAAAADVASGKYFYTAAGVLTEGTASGGGGAGFGSDTESGTYTPTADIARPTISFTKTHTLPPAIVIMADETQSGNSTYTNIAFVFVDYYRLFGANIYVSGSATRAAMVYYNYRASTSTGTVGGYLNISTDSDNTSSQNGNYSRYWASTTGFNPYTDNTSRYWKAGRTYKWIAIWA